MPRKSIGKPHRLTMESLERRDVMTIGFSLAPLPSPAQVPAYVSNYNPSILYQTTNPNGIYYVLGGLKPNSEISQKVPAVLNQFKKVHLGTDAINAVITGMDRTWQQQLYWIVKRPGSYATQSWSIVNQFKDRFHLTELPTTTLPENQNAFFRPEALFNKERLNWWKSKILAQAGSGFAHVVDPSRPELYGKAVDISVKNVSPALRVELFLRLQNAGINVLPEQGEKYGVLPHIATVFHCTASNNVSTNSVQQSSKLFWI